ncbi:A/G-specific adenine glycosylase [Salinibacillus xinjiangensis]|uniref:Adenine DNA glycosylase n=1 Tax=Salinibacillus xinjiangensis TaxID=1229268 RepID=A0A6G1X947_9BACI|nr:A/G-specific adenine glycosylase [Salinibacillus xinjiangensis]MRG87531.1 A/G-specific adenine glycosylase [Salinibacillus xinjiangensis]
MYQTSIDDFLEIEEFQQDLISWFLRVQRELPWRQNPTPYQVWVSEIMLQQTRVDTVIPYYDRFMQKYPNPEALAAAEEEDVLKTWEGLGYYSRARNLQTAVREVVSEYNGKVPDNAKELGQLKGVGPYTKGAILSIAYQQPEPAVDGNVMRVISRIRKVEEDIAKPKARKIIEGIVSDMISAEDPSSFNQGLMELGALICKPKNPLCDECPVQAHCRAYKEDLQEMLPIKSRKKSQRTEKYVALLIRDENHRILVQKRPEKGLLANLWQFPMIPMDKANTTDELVQWFGDQYGITIDVHKHLTDIKHVFSHIIWNLDVYSATSTGGCLQEGKGEFLSAEELQQLPFPVSHQKIARLI